ncbi:hypothetical protein ACFV24_32885 [Nocardia fluminea]|uniref:hypothetical protein n=1 Tax=Nocardia fluminea TaxID=134984 RepID=UPI00367098E0
MIAYLAQQVADTTANDSPWKLWAVPTGVVSAAIFGGLVAGFFALRTASKPKPASPHEKLKLLLESLDKWPEDLPGVETVHQAIGLALGEIRESDKLVEIPAIPGTDVSAAQEEQAKLEHEVDSIVRLRAIADYVQVARLTFSLASLVLISTPFAVFIGSAAAQRDLPIVILMGLGALFATLYSVTKISEYYGSSWTALGNAVRVVITGVEIPRHEDSVEHQV